MRRLGALREYLEENDVDVVAAQEMFVFGLGPFVDDIEAIRCQPAMPTRSSAEVSPHPPHPPHPPLPFAILLLGKYCSNAPIKPALMLTNISNLIYAGKAYINWLVADAGVGIGILG